MWTLHVGIKSSVKFGNPNNDCVRVSTIGAISINQIFAFSNPAVQGDQDDGYKFGKKSDTVVEHIANGATC